MKLKKIIAIFISCVFTLTSCGSTGAKESVITVVSREQGSGTRTAFTQITKVETKDENGEKVDNTYEEAIVQNSTNGVMMSIMTDKDAVGYISIGSLNNTVKAVNIEGVEPTQENIKSKKYKLYRDFNIVYKDGMSDLTKDFLHYILSDEGQNVVSAMGYISNKKGIHYKTKNMSGNITIGGSTSVAPLIEKLVEGYKQYNSDFTADIQATGSSAGAKATIDKTVDLGMLSRELKDSESILKKEVLATDGILVIVNNENSIKNLSLNEVKGIFTGDIKEWSKLNEK